MPPRTWQNDRVQTPKGDRSAVPRDIPKPASARQNNRDWGEEFVNAQSGGKKLGFDHTESRRRSVRAPAPPPQDDFGPPDVMELLDSGQLTVPELFEVFQMLLGEQM